MCFLDNICNVLSDKNPYDKAANEYYSFALHPMPKAYPEEVILYEIRDSVLIDIDKSLYFSKDCHLWATFRIDPFTKHPIEVRFSLDYTQEDRRILGLPVTKIEQLEKALKKDMIFNVPEKGKDADFLLMTCCIL